MNSDKTIVNLRFDWTDTNEIHYTFDFIRQIKLSFKRYYHQLYRTWSDL